MLCAQDFFSKSCSHLEGAITNIVSVSVWTPGFFFYNVKAVPQLPNSEKRSLARVF